MIVRDNPTPDDVMRAACDISENLGTRASVAVEYAAIGAAKALREIDTINARALMRRDILTSVENALRHI